MCVYAGIRFASSDDGTDGYGTEWLTYYDENGTEHTMNFSALPDDFTGWKYGGVYFYLYTRNNPNDPENLQIEKNGEIRSQYFDASRDTKALTHGWLSSGNDTWILMQKSYFLDASDLNVIIVDWHELAREPSYVLAVLSTRYVGKRLAKVLDSLVDNYNTTGERMHLAGHSLGAHVMGYAGMFFSKDIFRITGLDPARPLFELPQLPDDFRLDRTDAIFVDIIHTCAGVLGYNDSHGAMDFTPTGELPRNRAVKAIGDIEVKWQDHSRAYEYFSESIQGGAPFSSYLCGDYEAFERGECSTDTADMGAPAALGTEGNYYLHTNNQSKYAMGDEY
ncbi:inactive pancreatic lipase-related protein 1-like [Leguminivora glycinivorella]|uniref:inactive pancreatic lipase-related protein 1-like n=1 Tax=Leguminivora glycinivorella TaxID=1035111 RepID=UPI00200E3500|nr:inactive pancreatic lipase-related protein 1-like [Leguminivora glycinivorella]